MFYIIKYSFIVHSLGYTIPVPLRIDGLEIVGREDLIAAVGDQVFLCRKGSDNIRTYSIASFRRLTRTVVFRPTSTPDMPRPYDRVIGHGVISFRSMEAFGGDIFHDAHVRLSSHEWDVIARLDLPVTGKQRLMIDGSALKRLIDGLLGLFYPDKRGLRAVQYLVAAVPVDDEYNVYRLTGLRRRQSRPTLEVVETCPRCAEVLLDNYRQTSVNDLLHLSLFRSMMRDRRALVRDAVGRVLYLADDRSLHLFDADLQRVYSFGRLAIDGCQQARMYLDEQRGLLYVYGESGFLRVFSVRRSQKRVDE